MPTQSGKKMTAEDLRATHGEDARVEIIHGQFVPKAMPRYRHSRSNNHFLYALTRRFDRAPGGRWPGGWWICSELHVEYKGEELFCHDGCGFRRDLHESIPDEWPVQVRPDWVCELLSPGHEKQDLHDKWWVLHRAKVPHYWLVSPEERMLRIHRWDTAGYICTLTAGPGEVVRAEPFDAVELRVDVLFGDADDDE